VVHFTGLLQTAISSKINQKPLVRGAFFLHHPTDFWLGLPCYKHFSQVGRAKRQVLTDENVIFPT
jgi:hypothetical protein